jgi:hypothetical protein
MPIPSHSARTSGWLRETDSLPQPLIILNAAYSSYSPLIFTVQAKRLVPILRPDFVVVDIDETDLFDDAVRYRNLAVRDERGRLIAVAPDRQRLALLEGCARTAEVPIHLLRLTQALYYRLRLAQHDWSVRRKERLFAVGETSDPAANPELRDQMQYFRRVPRAVDRCSRAACERLCPYEIAPRGVRFRRSDNLKARERRTHDEQRDEDHPSDPQRSCTTAARVPARSQASASRLWSRLVKKDIIEALIGKTRHGEKGEAYGEATGRHQEATGLA